ncbi:hypothetical protein BJV78DRAFT_685277 [Lactifluus subvellereus]|nr:hypothetical protein BJV78DRAFT_685277 [Lactifluus subvellereus]
MSTRRQSRPLRRANTNSAVPLASQRTSMSSSQGGRRPPRPRVPPISSPPPPTPPRPAHAARASAAAQKRRRACVRGAASRPRGTTAATGAAHLTTAPSGLPAGRRLRQCFGQHRDRGGPKQQRVERQGARIGASTEERQPQRANTSSGGVASRGCRFFFFQSMFIVLRSYPQ